MATEEKKEASPDNEIAKELILDLDEQMKTTIKDLIRKAFTEETTFIKMCDLIKAKLQEKEEGKWNVIIGKDFSTFLVHRSRRYGLFKVGELNVLVWQSGSALS